MLLQIENRVSKPNAHTTRSGRAVKVPDRWESDEEVMVDFNDDEYDSDDGSDVSSTLSISDDEEEDEGEDLDDFIVDDDDEEGYCEDGEEEEDDDEEYCDSDEVE